MVKKILDVPQVDQRKDELTCVPASIKMVLDYISRIEHPSKNVPEFSVEDIAKILRTDELGTPLENIKNLNKNERILLAIPSIEFVDKNGCRFDEIKTELENNRPIISWISPSEIFTGLSHSVVITGIDEGKLLVYYNDPLYGKKVESMVKFLSMWDRADRVLIKIKIGARTQRLLDEFPKDKREIEQ